MYCLRSIGNSTLQIQEQVRGCCNVKCISFVCANGTTTALYRVVRYDPLGACSPPLMSRVFEFSGSEMCFSQGWPSELRNLDPQWAGNAFSNAELQQQAGNLFSLPVSTCIMYAFFPNPYAPWCSENSAKTGRGDDSFL